MANIRHIIYCAVISAFVPLSINAVTLTVSKTGTAQYQSIQAAVNAARPGDEVVILDTAVYEEMVTIDSTKNGLVLRADKPRAAARPTIMYKDTIHIRPRNYAESLIDSLLDFDQNGALRVIGATGVRIEGVNVDGGEVFPFGYEAVWESKYPLQHGNAAITLWKAGDVIITDCEMRNAYFGVNVKDKNRGGVFPYFYAADLDTNNTTPFSAVGRTGNHLVEHCRIHNNSVGMFLESAWDMGSTIRYNLFYENHHPTAAVAAKVKALTNEGGNQSGGALMFKDQMLSPVAIYNNTFWHNSLPFLGSWKAGGQHLIFNNIYGSPNEYFGVSTTTFTTSFEMSKCFANRMHNSVYAAQQQAPTLNYTTITNDLKPVQSAGGVYKQGVLITPFPAAAEVRWVETPFLSTDPSSPVFLTPDWNDTIVMNYLVDKGWEAAGVKDPDGTRADVGAIPLGGGRPVDVVTIRPTVPVQFTPTITTLGFTITPRVGTMTGVTLKMLGLVQSLDTSDVYGSAYKAIPLSKMAQITIPTTPLTIGANSINVPNSVSEFAFFELIAEGTGSDGRPFTTAAGFIPYRKFANTFEISILNANGGAPVNEIRAGAPVILSIKPLTGSGPFSDKVYPIAICLASRGSLLDAAGKPVGSITGGITGSAEITVVFPAVPAGGFENVLVSGRSITASKVLPFFGASNTITILPDPTSARTVTNIVPKPGNYRCELIDLRGRVVQRSDRIESAIASGSLAQRFGSFGRGVYLVRMTDLGSGRVVQMRHINLGR